MFLAAVDAGMIPLAVIGLLSSVVTAYYYLRIIKVMYFEEDSTPLDAWPDWGIKLVVGLAAVGMIAITFAPSGLLDAALKAAQGFVG